MKEIIIINPLGLHARPAALFCTKAKRFISDVTISKDGKAVNAKSVMMVMTIGVECGDQVQITANGPDAKEAEEKLVELLSTLED